MTITLELELYNSQIQRWPESGKHILAQYDNNSIVVYQAFKNSIAEYALKNQKFGGDDYSWMTWIKPNFVWMMYRSGWATKRYQERVLAIKISLEGFNSILYECVPSSFGASHFSDEKSWRRALENSNVRLQWDPDHDLNGKKLERRAIQLGIRGEKLTAKYSNEWILNIEDITEFVKEQYEHVKSGNLDMVWTPREEVYEIKDEKVTKILGIDSQEISG
ncbi:8382_t:CDS:2 [Diversispora eburnea]|uniref:8382_t:CDS:1 n=1 Tax=Diversispora eburnea TaxID=1213867 RepID=A0A9N9G0J8_9GLOM|nr:8382_t:CDS:2 [Diversispora eburnea]